MKLKREVDLIAIFSSSFYNDNKYRISKLLLKNNARILCYRNSFSHPKAIYWEDLVHEITNAEGKGIKLLNEIGLENIENETFAEHFSVQEINLWPIFYLYLNRDIINSINFIERFKQIFKKINVGKIYIESDQELMSNTFNLSDDKLFERKLLISFCQKNNIKVIRIKHSIKHIIISSVRIIPKRIIKNIYFYHLRVLVKILRKLLAYLYSAPDQKSEPKLAFVTHSRYWNKSNTQSKGTKYIDSMMDPIKRKISKDIDILHVDCDFTLSGNVNNLLTMLKDKNYKWIPLEKYFSLFEWYKLGSFYRHKTSNYKLKEFIKLFQFDGVEFGELYEKKIKMLLDVFCKEYFIYNYIARKMIERENIQSTLLLYETGPYERAIINSARLFGIPSFGLQHGIIHPDHPDYIYYKEYKSLKIALSFPDYFFAFNNYTKKILTDKSLYEEKNVYVVGDPRNDDIYKFISNQIDEIQENRIGLILTADFSRKDEHEDFYKIVFQTIKQKTEYKWVIKPHPSQNMKTLLENINMNNLMDNVVIESENLYQLIKKSSCILSYSSTALYEVFSIDAYKPVFLIMPSTASDHLCFAKSGSVYKISDVSEIDEAFKLMSSLTKNSDIIINRKRLIEEHCFSVDGRTGERISNIILKRFYM